LCASLRTKLRGLSHNERSIPDPRAWLDLAAIGTICDMVPLVGENRVLVQQGLGSASMRRRPALDALLRRGRVGERDAVTENFVAFTVGPRLNAPGRIGPAEPALKLLCAGSPKEAAPLLREVEAINRDRKRYQFEVLSEAEASIAGDAAAMERHALVLSSPRWLHGVVGIAASSLASRHARPAFVMAEDSESGELRGSARTFGGVDVHGVLEDCSALLIRHGGHTAAAGFSLRRENFEPFVDAVDGAVARQKDDIPTDPAVYFDAEIGMRELNTAVLSEIRCAAPFGQGFTAPALLCDGARVRMRKVFAEQHLELVVEQGGAEHRAVVFGAGSAPINPGDRVSFLYEPELDLYRGGDRLSLRILQIWHTSA
ncbi:MAG: single-stranded-DNA-specific exonuclease RecJ, partial [Nannocystaceae bacterium]